MRVMCIADNWIEGYQCENHPRPKYGEIDEVIDECWDKIDYYELQRFPGIIFAKQNFIPLSSIDETELIKEREQVLLTP